MGSPKQRPLMLKDYLREDQSFDSPGGFAPAARDETTVRRLLDLELAGGRLARDRPKGATLTRISAFFNAFRSLAAASSAPKGPLQRSLSRRLLPRTFLRRRACSRREERGRLEDAKKRLSAGRVLIKDVIRLESFVDEARGGGPVLSPPAHPSSPACSCSTSGWSEVESSSGCDSLPSPPSPVPGSPPDKNKRPNDSALSSTPKDRNGNEEQDGAVARAACRDYEEKEQLSPVSVMDFPYDEEEEAAAEAEASPSFQRSLASIERTTAELLKKIRRFESLARLVDPVALDGAFSPAPDEQVGGDDEACVRAREILGEATWRRSEEALLLDFFSQGLRGGAPHDRAARERRLLRAAREWEDGVVPKEALVAEMDSDGRWVRRSDVDEGVAGDVEGEVLASLLEELVEEILFLD